MPQDFLDDNISTKDGSGSNHAHQHLEQHMESALKNVRTAGSISMSAELFEKIYLSPKNQVSNNIRSTFGNPTPLAIAGFVLTLTPLSNVLMGWRGAGGLGAAGVGTYYFFGGLLMVLGSFLEFILGNTFPFVVFGTFGAYWLSFGATLTPFYNASAAYKPSDPATAASDPTFNATFAYFQLYMALLCLIFLVASLRTNICFFLIFLLLTPTFCCLAGVFFYGAEGLAAPSLMYAAGVMAFLTSLLGWYLLLVQLLASVDFPLNLPVGDLSRLIKGASDKIKE